MEILWRAGVPYVTPVVLRRAARAALAHGGRPRLALSIALVGDRELARLHGDWLADPSRTDVITFDLSDELGELGELVVSAECARRTARARGVAPARELCLYVVHGVLHLCGHDDRAPGDRARMRAAESDVLRALGWPADTLPHDEGP